MVTLQRAMAQGHKAAVIFVVQRPDAHSFSTNVDADPRFAAALGAAARSGVEVLAYGCTVSRTDIELSNRLPVRVV